MSKNHDEALRRLRVLQVLQRAQPNPMGEAAVLNAVRVDPELSPTLENIRDAMRYLGEVGFSQNLFVVDSDWLAGRITDAGIHFLEDPSPDDSVDIYNTTEKPEPASLYKVGGRVSSITVLPTEVKAWLDQELVRRQFTGYLELESLLAEQGYEISKSALGRYGKKFKEEQKQLKQSIDMAKAFAEVVGDDGAAMNQTLTVLAQQELMSIIRDGKYDDEIKLPALVRSISSLNRSDINTRKFQIEQAARKKALAEAADAVEQAAHEQGLTQDQAQFWRGKVLGVQ